MPASMAGQDPFEGEIEQALHRAGLLLPGVPAGVAKGNEMPAAGRPGEVVPGEQKLLAVEEHCVSAGVTGSRDREEVFGQGDRLQTGQLPLDAFRAAGDVALVEHALAAEAPREFF